MPTPNFPLVRPTPSVVPAKQHPHLKRLMNEVDFACASCSSAMGQPVYYTLAEAHLEPISGPPNPKGGIVTEKGMIATRYLVMCPEDRTVPENNALMMGGIVDLMAIDPNYKRPFRPQGNAGTGITFDDEDTPAVNTGKDTRKFGSSRLKTDSDLKPKKLSARDQKLVAKAIASNREAVPQGALAEAKGTKKKAGKKAA